MADELDGALLDRFITDLGVDLVDGGRPAIERGVGQINVQLRQIGLEVAKARLKNEPLSRAVSDFVGYPNLALVHAAVDDVMYKTLPPHYLSWTEVLLREFPIDLVTTLLVDRAANDDDVERRGTWQLLLFEAIRVRLMLFYVERPDLAEEGIDFDSVSHCAEEKMLQWLAEKPAVPQGVRPFRVIVEEACSALERYQGAMRTHLRRIQKDTWEVQRFRAFIDSEVAKMNARDAVLIRNHMSSAMGERPVTVELLREKHPIAFGRRSRNADHQRMVYIREVLRCGEIKSLYRKGPSVLDVGMAVVRSDVAPADAAPVEGKAGRGGSDRTRRQPRRLRKV